MLEEERGIPIRAFVVWEPILWTDLGPPSTRRLASVSDARVRQYWDPKHLVSAAVTSSDWAARHGLSAQTVNVGGKQVAWDLVLVFPPGSCQDGGLPEPALHGDPVVTTIRDVPERLRALARP